TKARYRADQLTVFAFDPDPTSPQSDWRGPFFATLAPPGAPDEELIAPHKKHFAALSKQRAIPGKKPGIVRMPGAINFPDNRSQTFAPGASQPGTLTEPRAFNLMFQTYVGAVQDAANIAYLRPETAQGIFVNFRNVLDSTRLKLPF